MKRSIIGTMLCLIAAIGLGQTKIEKLVPVKAGQKVRMNFKYPDLIRIHTWERNEIEVKGTVSINMGEDDNAFEIQVNDAAGELEILSQIRDYEGLKRYTIIRYDNRDFYFDGGWDDPEIKKFFEEHGRDNVSWISNGVAKDILLEIKVPATISLDIYSRHGMIEILDVPASIAANSRHRGVDIAVPVSAKYDFELITRHGEVYTNLDLNIISDPNYEPHKWKRIEAKLNGGGRKAHLESRHGNIYLRSKQ